MHVNYATLIPAIYQKCQGAMLSGESWELLKNKTMWSIFDSELKDSFDASVIDLGGHNESCLAGHTMKDLAASTSQNSQNLYERIKENTMRQLGKLVNLAYKRLVAGQSYDDIHQYMMSAPVHFYIVPVINQSTPTSYCFVCGKYSSYYMKEGIISEGCSIDESSPYWEHLHDDYKIMLRGEGTSASKGCAYPHGIDHYEQYITIKSNYLVFANDLRNILNIDPIESMKYVSERSGYHNTINSEVGSMYEQEHSLNKGLIKVQVGNTSPIVAYNSKTGAILAADPNAWKSKKRHTFPFEVADFKSKGKICTDVWTVQAVDSIVFESYAKDNDLSLKEAAAKHGFLIPVKPGRYKITNFNAHHYSNRPVFFSMEKVD